MFSASGRRLLFTCGSFGPAASFAYGWTYLLLSAPSAWAAVALVFAGYCGALVALDPTGVRIVATMVITFVTIAHMISVRLAAGIQNFATSAKILALTAIIRRRTRLLGRQESFALHVRPVHRALAWRGHPRTGDRYGFSASPIFVEPGPQRV